MMGIWVSIVSMVGISMSIVSMMSISIVGIVSISSWLSISRPLTIVISMVSIGISIVTVVGITMVGKTVVSMVTMETISMVSIGISIVSMVSKAIAIAKVMAISMVAIKDTSIGTGISLTGYCGKHAQSNYSNGFHHFQCLQA